MHPGTDLILPDDIYPNDTFRVESGDNLTHWRVRNTRTNQIIAYFEIREDAETYRARLEAARA